MCMSIFCYIKLLEINVLTIKILYLTFRKAEGRFNVNHYLSTIIINTSNMFTHCILTYKEMGTKEHRCHLPIL
jgi:hypothetical protein